jgi:hypothetical protein
MGLRRRRLQAVGEYCYPLNVAVLNESAPQMQGVSDWLEKLDLSEYAQRFADS